MSTVWFKGKFTGKPTNPSSGWNDFSHLLDVKSYLWPHFSFTSSRSNWSIAFCASFSCHCWNIAVRLQRQSTQPEYRRSPVKSNLYLVYKCMIIWRRYYQHQIYHDKTQDSDTHWTWSGTNILSNQVAAPVVLSPLPPIWLRPPFFSPPGQTFQLQVWDLCF